MIFIQINLYRKLDLFREFDATPRVERTEAEVPKADISELLRPSSLLEQITEGGDPMERYLRELARADAAAPEESDPQREAALGNRMRGLLHHPRFQAVESSLARAGFCDSRRRRKIRRACASHNLRKRKRRGICWRLKVWARPACTRCSAPVSGAR